MGKTLTVRAVESMVAGVARREVPDGLIPALYLVLQPSGAKSWAVRYRAAGVPRKLTLGSYPGIPLKAARELAQRALVDAAGGGDPAAAKKAAKRIVKAPADRYTVEKVATSFVERYAKANTRETSWRETERILNREVITAWKGRSLADIRRADVHELLDSIVDRGSPIMANRVLAAVRRMFGWAVERGIIDASPCDRVKAPAPARTRDRVLTDDELREALRAFDGLGHPFGPLFRLLVLTGQRREEVGAMRWTELDLDARLWTLPKTRAKNGLEHVVPLSDAAVAILRAMPRVLPDSRAKVATFVFTTNGRAPVSGYGRVKAKLDALLAAQRVEAGDETPFPHFVLHDLRRTAATGMARLGVALPVVEKVLNHTSGSFAGIVGVYQRHGFADEKRHALDAWASFVEGLVRPAGANVVPIIGRGAR